MRARRDSHSRCSAELQAPARSLSTPKTGCPFRTRHLGCRSRDQCCGGGGAHHQAAELPPEHADELHASIAACFAAARARSLSSSCTGAFKLQWVPSSCGQALALRILLRFTPRGDPNDDTLKPRKSYATSPDLRRLLLCHSVLRSVHLQWVPSSCSTEFILLSDHRIPIPICKSACHRSLATEHGITMHA